MSEPRFTTPYFCPNCGAEEDFNAMEESRYCDPEDVSSLCAICRGHLAAGGFIDDDDEDPEDSLEVDYSRHESGTIDYDADSEDENDHLW